MGNQGYDILAAANVLTGLIKAFDLHADANPNHVMDLRLHADEVRAVRDDLLKATEMQHHDLNSYGSADEWAAVIGHFTQGSGGWSWKPSRDPLQRADG